MLIGILADTAPMLAPACAREALYRVSSGFAVGGRFQRA